MARGRTGGFVDGAAGTAGLLLEVFRKSQALSPGPDGRAVVVAYDRLDPDSDCQCLLRP